jgi:hypothetical protein
MSQGEPMSKGKEQSEPLWRKKLVMGISCLLHKDMEVCANKLSHLMKYQSLYNLNCQYTLVFSLPLECQHSLFFFSFCL